MQSVHVHIEMKSFRHPWASTRGRGLIKRFDCEHARAPETGVEAQTLWVAAVKLLLLTSTAEQSASH